MVALGPYTFEVLTAYAGALGLLFLLITVSIWRGRRVARRLMDVEARRKRASVPPVPPVQEPAE